MRPAGFEGCPQPPVSSHGERLDRYSISIPAPSPPISRPVSPLHPSAVSRKGTRQHGASNATEGLGPEGSGADKNEPEKDGQAEELPETADGKSPRPELKGRAMLDSIAVKSEYNSMNRLFHTYMIMLRMPPPYFLLFLLSCPLLLSLFFSLLYLLEPSGLEPSARSHFFSDSPLEQRLSEVVGPHVLLTFFYSLSIATAMGGGPMEARSPFCLLVANLETLCAQLIFVFLSGAVFQRLSQPVSPVRWAKVALIADDKWAGSGVKAHKVFSTRFILQGPEPCHLIDAKFELILRRHIISDSGSRFVTHTKLPLVRESAPFLRYGMVLRHVIDESSPLYKVEAQEMLVVEDCSFDVTIFGLERSSMQPIFARAVFCVYDKEVLWDREFEDMFSQGTMGNRTYYMDQRKVQMLKPI